MIRILLIFSINFTLSAFLHAQHNVGAGSAPVSPYNEVYLPGWASETNIGDPHPPQQYYYAPPGSVGSTYDMYTQDRNQNWALYPIPQGGYTGIDLQGQEKNFNPSQRQSAGYGYPHQRNAGFPQ